MNPFRTLTLALTFSIGSVAFSQSSFLDLTIVESTNFNRPVANFSYSNFENMFVMTAGNQPTILEANINRALTIFLNNLRPERSYVIQHEPTYYFVFQFDSKENRYLVLNNTIGERNKAFFADTFNYARREMFVLLQTFYNNIPIVSVREFR